MKDLRTELSRYNEFTVPEYLYEAYTILFLGKEDRYTTKQRREILDKAWQDLNEDELLRKERVFNRDRRQLPGKTKKKFNWGSRY